MSREGRSWAPFVVFGGIAAIGLTSVIIVIVGYVNREQPYLDPVLIKDIERARRYERTHLPRSDRPTPPPAKKALATTPDTATDAGPTERETTEP